MLPDKTNQQTGFFQTALTFFSQQVRHISSQIDGFFKHSNKKGSYYDPDIYPHFATVEVVVEKEQQPRQQKTI